MATPLKLSLSYKKSACTVLAILNAKYVSAESISCNVIMSMRRTEWRF